MLEDGTVISSLYVDLYLALLELEREYGRPVLTDQGPWVVKLCDELKASYTAHLQRCIGSDHGRWNAAIKAAKDAAAGPSDADLLAQFGTGRVLQLSGASLATRGVSGNTIMNLFRGFEINHVDFTIGSKFAYVIFESADGAQQALQKHSDHPLAAGGGELNAALLKDDDEADYWGRVGAAPEPYDAFDRSQNTVHSATVQWFESIKHTIKAGNLADMRVTPPRTPIAKCVLCDGKKCTPASRCKGAWNVQPITFFDLAGCEVQA